MGPFKTSLNSILTYDFSQLKKMIPLKLLKSESAAIRETYKSMLKIQNTVTELLQFFLSLKNFDNGKCPEAFGLQFFPTLNGPDPLIRNLKILYFKFK